MRPSKTAPTSRKTASLEAGPGRARSSADCLYRRVGGQDQYDPAAWPLAAREATGLPCSARPLVHHHDDLLGAHGRAPLHAWLERARPIPRSFSPMRPR